MDEATWDQVIQYGIEFAARYARVSTTPFQRNLQKHENTSHRHPYKRVFTTDYMA